MFPDAIADALRTALASAASAGDLPSLDVVVEVERPRERDHGDWSSNVALAVAKDAGKAPREVAEILESHLPSVPHLEVVELAGPGFMNFRLARSWLEEVLKEAGVVSEPEVTFHTAGWGKLY